MSTGTERLLVPVAVPPDAGVLDLLPVLRDALSGAGPAVLPYPADRPAPIAAGGVALASDQDDAYDPTVVAVSTSGSTGAAKAVLLPASALLASIAATHDRLGGPGRWLLALPAQHVAGLQVLFRSLVARTRPVVLDLGAGFDVEAFVAAAEQVRAVRRYTSLVPTQLVRLLAGGPAAVAALTGFDAVLVGGAATPAPLVERARAAGVRLVTTYGMSETCGGCVYDGVPLDGVQVSAGADGRISLGGAVVARGYRPLDGVQPDSPFSLDAAGVRWFRTDDSGGWHDGRLVVAGRIDDVVITGGLNVSPGPVEAALLSLPGVAEAAVVGLPDPEWGQRVAAAVVLSPGAEPPTLELLRAHVTAAVAGHAAPRQLTVLPALPLRGPGKPDRPAIRAALLDQPDHVADASPQAPGPAAQAPAEGTAG